MHREVWYIRSLRQERTVYTNTILYVRMNTAYPFSWVINTLRSCRDLWVLCAAQSVPVPEGVIYAQVNKLKSQM